MKKSYIYVTGGKGGIGKSTVALALVDYKADECGEKILLIDADPNNPDSSTAYKDNKDSRVAVKQMRIRSEDTSGQIDSSGMMETLNALENKDTDTIILDAPAGDTELLAGSGKSIIDACRSIAVKSVFVWLVDSVDRTAANTLAAVWETIKNADLILVVKNCRKGTNFESFDTNKTMQTILSAANVKTIELPKIASRLEEHMRIDRMNWLEIATKTPLGNRVEAQRLRNTLHQAFKLAGL